MMAADDVYLDSTSETCIPDAIRLISSAGFCVLRGLMPATVAAYYRDLTQQALDRPRDSDRDRRYKYNPATAASSIQEFDHLGDGALKLLRHVFVAPVSAVHRHFLGAEFRCCLEHSRIRRQYGNIDRPTHHKPHLWHQDAGVGYTGAEMMNVWVAMTACGVEAPSLELARAFNPPVHTDPVPVGMETVEVIARPGDAILFLSRTIHRTQAGIGLNGMRYSCDIRSTSAATAPANMTGCTFINPGALFDA